MTRARALRTFAALLCGALLAGAALGARADLVPGKASIPAPAPSAPPAGEAALAAPPAPRVIPAPEIVTRAEDAKVLVKRILDTNAQDQAEQEIEASLPETSAKLRERTARAEALLENAPTFDALNDLDNEWRTRMQRLNASQLTLTRSAKRIEADRAALHAEHELWEATRSAPENEGLPTATRERIAETLDMLASAERKLQAQRSRILTLQDEVANEELVVNGMVDRVAQQRDDVSKRLLNRDAPPLWRGEAWAPSGDAAFVPERIRAAIDRKLDLIHEFLTLSLARLQLELTIFVCAFSALMAARRRVTRSVAAQTDPALAMPTRIFERPVSAAVVVAVVWTTWILPRAPGVLGEAEALVLLIPVLRLLPVELVGDMRAAVVGLAALFVYDSVRGVLAAVPTVERFLILPELAGAIWLLVYAQRPQNAARLRSIGVLGPIAVPVVRFALAVCVAALLLNVVGLVLVSRLMLRGVLVSIYAGIAIYALVRFASGVVTAALRSDFLRKLQSVRSNGELIRRRINGAQRWLGVIAWGVISLRVVGLETSARGLLAHVFQAQFQIGTISISLGNFLAFGLTVYVSILLSQFVRFVLDEDVLPHLSLPRGVPAAVSMGLHYLILATGFFIAIGAAGVDLSKFGLIAGALGVGIGFGLQNVVNNFVSGLILLFERPMQTGDMIEVGGLSGEVKRIGIRSSTLRTGEGADVIVPNATLISDKLVNWTFADRARRFDLEVSVARGSDVSKVIAILLETASGRSEVLSLPAPVALFTRISESALVLQLQVWCRVEVGAQVRSELGIAVLDALRGAGIELAYPRQDVQLRFESSPE
ncbi:MAG TPA: mechanosensitive ion channel domain-containing protein [Myxococcota bacterium]|nr:mechanosensitive ion channel domain-containing protein [Myxococcota bacterium]